MVDGGRRLHHCRALQPVPHPTRWQVSQNPRRSCSPNFNAADLTCLRCFGPADAQASHGPALLVRYRGDRLRRRARVGRAKFRRAHICRRPWGRSGNPRRPPEERRSRGGPGPVTVLFVFVAQDRRPAVRRGRRPAQIHPLVADRGAQARRRAGHRGRGDARRAPYHPMTQGSTSSSSRSTIARGNLAGGGRRRTADHVPGVGSREDWRPRVSTMNSWSESYREHRRPNVLNQATAAWA